MKSRTVITGLGALTALGRGVERQVQCLRQGTRFMKAPTLFDAGQGGPVAQVLDEDLPAPEEGHENLGSRACRLTLASVDEALAQARLPEEVHGALAIFLGTTSSGILEGEVAFEGVGPGDPRPDYRFFDDQYVAGALGRAVARMRGIHGPRVTISTACSSSANALAQAACGIQQGRFPAALVVGVDTLTRMTYFGFGSLGLISDEGCRPFDADRRGLTLGEGAACVILEDEERARSRGASILSRVLGWARNVDGHHITQPDPQGSGIEACIRQALKQGGLAPGDVQYVNAHGTGTPQNDLVEGGVLGRVFGDETAVASTKSYTGHTLGAAGVLEALYSVVALEHHFVPATLGVRQVDGRIDVDVVTGQSRFLYVRAVLSSSFGFGGNNCCLLLGREDGP